MAVSKPSVLIAHDAEQYVRAVVQAVDAEVGGLCFVERQKNGDLYVYEYVLLKQEVSAAGIEFEDESMHAFMVEASKRDDFGNLRGSWHSHANMGVYFSNIDTDDAIEKYKGTGTPWLLSMVYNRKGQVKTRLDIFDSAAVEHIYMDDLSYAVMENTEARSEVEAEVKEKVTIKESEYKYNTGGGYRAPGKSKRGGESSRFNGSTPSPEDARRASAEKGTHPILVIEGGRRKVYRNGHIIMDEPFRKGAKIQAKRDKELRKYLDSLGCNVSLLKLDETTPFEHGKLSDEEFKRLDTTAIHEMSDEEYVAYAEACGIPLDRTTKALLLGQDLSGADYGGF